jgi:GNAT superfamily N-acetyltransferase
MRYVVRAATADEIPVISELMTQAYTEALLKLGLEAVDASTVADGTIRQVLTKLAADHQDDMIVQVAEDTERGIIAGGAAAYIQRPIRSCHGIYVWVRDEYRGRAMFTRAMFRYTEQQARERGANRLEIAVMLGEPRTHRIYERLGYSGYATVMMKPLRRTSIAAQPDK